MAKSKIIVQQTEIDVIKKQEEYFISLTDIAQYRSSEEPFSIINNWMRTRRTIEFIGLWEKLNNPEFKPIDFERFRTEAGSNYFVLSPQRWIKAINAVRNYFKIGQELPQSERLQQFNTIAITQMTSLTDNRNLKKMR